MTSSMRTSLSLAALGLGAATLLAAMPPAHAEDAPAPVVPPETVAPVAPATTTTNVTVLPLFGTTLAVNLVSDGSGVLTEVNLSNVDGYTATMVKPNRVAFESNDGTNTVVVKNRPDGGQRVEARAGSLGDISGPGSWTGDVFGDGRSTTVAFTVGELDGGPDIAVTSVSDPTAQVGEVRREVEGDEAQAGVRIRFSNGTLTRELRIRAAVETDENGTAQAKLTVGLGRLREDSNGEGGQPVEPPKAGETSQATEPPRPSEPPKPAKGKEPNEGSESKAVPPSVNTPIASTTTEPRRERNRERGGAPTTTVAPGTSAAPQTTEVEHEDHDD